MSNGLGVIEHIKTAQAKRPPKAFKMHLSLVSVMVSMLALEFV